MTVHLCFSCHELREIALHLLLKKEIKKRYYYQSLGAPP
jgi:hypothetical protein